MSGSATRGTFLVGLLHFLNPRSVDRYPCSGRDVTPLMRSDRIRANRKPEMIQHALQRDARRNSEPSGAAELLVFALALRARDAGILPVSMNTRGRVRSGASRQFPPLSRERFPQARSEFPQESVRAGKRAVAARCQRCAGTRRVSA